MNRITLQQFIDYLETLDKSKFLAYIDVSYISEDELPEIVVQYENGHVEISN